MSSPGRTTRSTPPNHNQIHEPGWKYTRPAKVQAAQVMVLELNLGSCATNAGDPKALVKVLEPDQGLINLITNLELQSKFVKLQPWTRGTAPTTLSRSTTTTLSFHTNVTVKTGKETNVGLE